jgi:hypothetical protein
MPEIDFTKYFGPYCAIEIDYCGEAVSWGYPIAKLIESELWDGLKLQYKLFRSNPGYFGGTWYVITKTLTRLEAIEKYGPISNEVTGPRGGFKSAMFGDKLFYSKYLK